MDITFSLWDPWGLKFISKFRHLSEAYCTLIVGNHMLVHSFRWGILYPCGWKIIPWLPIYVRYIVPLWSENHTLVYPFMWVILYCKSMKFHPLAICFIPLIIYLCNIYCTVRVWISTVKSMLCTNFIALKEWISFC